MNNTTETDHQQLVAACLKPGSLILASMTPEKANLAHLGLLVTTEASELADAIKKHVAYELPIDMENVVEELGDLEFALHAIRSSLGVTREQCLIANVAKLSKRYKSGGFSNKEAKERADKA